MISTTGNLTRFLKGESVCSPRLRNNPSGRSQLLRRLSLVFCIFNKCLCLLGCHHFSRYLAVSLFPRTLAAQVESKDRAHAGGSRSTALSSLTFLSLSPSDTNKDILKKGKKKNPEQALSCFRLPARRALPTPSRAPTARRQPPHGLPSRLTAHCFLPNGRCLQGFDLQLQVTGGWQGRPPAAGSDQHGRGLALWHITPKPYLKGVWCVGTGAS